MSDIDLVKKVRVYAEEAEKNGFEVLTVPLRDLFPLLGRMEAAERERDELRAEQAEHDEQIARMESKFSLAKRALDSKTARCEKAEAELRRRDAAAGEPVAVVDIQRGRGDGKKYALCYTSAGHSLPDDIYNLYTTPPAARAPEWSNAQCMEFLTVAFRQCDISGDIEMDDIRLGVKMANAAAPAPGGDDVKQG